MTKIKHPKSRGERLRLKQKKDKFNAFERADAVSRRHQFEVLEQKEILDELRKKVLAVEEERTDN
jgi:hypothetical protein